MTYTYILIVRWLYINMSYTAERIRCPCASRKGIIVIMVKTKTITYNVYTSLISSWLFCILIKTLWLHIIISLEELSITLMISCYSLNQQVFISNHFPTFVSISIIHDRLWWDAVWAHGDRNQSRPPQHLPPRSQLFLDDPGQPRAGGPTDLPHLQYRE